jgi:O-antigen/teichoic acid export membrane protein
MSWGCQVASIAGSFIVTPALIHGLGEKLYGSWLLINSFITHLRTLDLGMSAGTLKFSAGALARGDRSRLVQIHSSGAAIFAFACALALVATGVLALVLPGAFPEALAGQERVILVLGIAGALDLLFHPHPSSLRARSFYFVPDSIEIATYSIFKLGLVLYLSRTGISLWLLCLLMLAEAVVRNVAVSGAALSLCDWTRRLSPKAVDRVTVGALARYGGGSFAINVGELVRFQLSSAVIGYFLAADRITVYSIGMRLVHMAYQAIGVIGAVSVPRFSGLHERGDREGYLRVLRNVNLATGLATGYVLANVAVLGLPFLRMWIRKPWVDEAFAVTLVMLPGYFVGLLSAPGAMLLMGAGKLRGMTALTLAEAACNLALSVALVGPLGIYGVCLGTMIPMVLFRGVVFPFLLRACVDVPVGTYWRSHLAGIGVALGYAALVLPVRLLDLSTPAAFVGAGVCTTALFAALALAAVPEARATARRLWSRARA